jgi:hypothetical protein
MSKACKKPLRALTPKSFDSRVEDKREVVHSPMNRCWRDNEVRSRNKSERGGEGEREEGHISSRQKRNTTTQREEMRPPPSRKVRRLPLGASPFVSALRCSFQFFRWESGMRCSRRSLRHKSGVIWEMPSLKRLNQE